jgi:hypothetical protein
VSVTEKLRWTRGALRSELLKARRFVLVVALVVLALTLGGQYLAYRNALDLVAAVQGLSGSGIAPFGSMEFVDTVVGQAPGEFQALTASHGLDSPVAFCAGTVLGVLLLGLLGASFSGSEWDRRMAPSAFVVRPTSTLVVKFVCAVGTAGGVILLATLGNTVFNVFLTAGIDRALPGFSELAATSQGPGAGTAVTLASLCAVPSALGFLGGLLGRRTAAGAAIVIGLYLVDTVVGGFLGAVPEGILPFTALSSVIRAVAPGMQDAGTFSLMTAPGSGSALTSALSLGLAITALGAAAWLRFKRGV